MSSARVEARPLPVPRLGWSSHPGVAWIAWVVLSALHLRPLLNTTVIADDLLNPFQQFADAGASPAATLDFVRAGVEGAGHFNYLGQLVGALYNGTWLLVASRTGISMLEVHAATKLLVLLATALAAASFVRAVCAAVGRDVSVWAARVLVSLLLFGTLQLHLVWSNDPVGSYPLAGFVSAAIGFRLLALAAAPDLTRAGVWLLGLLGTLAVLYYELNVAAVVGVGLVLVWQAWRREGLRGTGRRLALLSPAVLLPFLVTVLLQLRASSLSASYTGTDVEAGGSVARTAAVGVLSSLPGAGWRLSWDYLSGPPALLVLPLVVLGVVLLVLTQLAPRLELGRGGRSLGTGWLLVAAPAAYAGAAILLQASTVKVQQEMTQVGMVYTFYAISSTAVAALLALALLLVRREWVQRSLVALPALAAGVAFVVVQTLVNASISVQFNSTIQPQSRALLEAYDRELSTDQRCGAVQAWTALELPDYYEVGMVEGLQAAYQHYHDEPFCPGFVRR